MNISTSRSLRRGSSLTFENLVLYSKLQYTFGDNTLRILFLYVIGKFLKIMRHVLPRPTRIPSENSKCHFPSFQSHVSSFQSTKISNLMRFFFCIMTTSWKKAYTFLFSGISKTFIMVQFLCFPWKFCCLQFL